MNSAANWVVETTRKGHLLLTRGTESVLLDLKRGQIESLRSGSREVLADPFYVVLARKVSPRSLRRRALIRERAKRVRRSQVVESADGVDVTFELKSRWGAASLTVRADAADGILLRLSVHPGGHVAQVGLRTRLDSAFDQVRWGRRVRPAADSRRADRVGWHRRDLRELLGAGPSDSRSHVEHVEVGDEASRLRVAAEGGELLRFALGGTRTAPAGSLLDIDVDLPADRPPFDSADERSTAVRLTWSERAA